MADRSHCATNSQPDGSIYYDIGPLNWQPHTIPDIRKPGSAVTLISANAIDVVILGDGFQNPADFETELTRWTNMFFDVDVYDRMSGAFRIRALYRPSKEPATHQRNAHYRTLVNDKEDDIAGGDWQNGTHPDDLHFRQRLFDDLYSFPGVNLDRYPSGRSFNDNATGVDDGMFGGYKNLVVVMIIRTSKSRSTKGGFGRVFRHPGSADTPALNVSFGQDYAHEFGHAFCRLRDEYIRKHGRNLTSNGRDPAHKNVLTLTNLCHSTDYDDVPWKHISPWGRAPRQGSTTSPSPVLGWLWMGGSRAFGVWHSEYRCLMNGRHDNYEFTRDWQNDPTVQTDGSYKPDKGARLRDPDRYCQWCQEIVTIRILEKTGQLHQPGDPTDIVEAGKIWYTRWDQTLRANYWTIFNVVGQIATQETNYAATRPAGQLLKDSDLYQPFTCEPQPETGVPQPYETEEWLLALG